MKNPILWLFGYQKLKTDEKGRLAVLNLLLQNRFHFLSPTVNEDESFSFVCSLQSAKRINLLASQRQIALSVEEKGGVPYLLSALKNRWGLIFGVLIGMFLLFFSRLYLWQIRIEGNERFTSEEIIAELEAAGLRTGTYLPRLNPSEVENRLLQTSNRLSWVSIYMNGTVAEVQVIEQVEAKQTQKKKPANLIAGMDGQIEGVEIYRGDLLVGIGQAVKAGEVLVSGVYDSAAVGYRLTRANGKVFARTNRTLSYEISYQTTEKVYEKSSIGKIEFHFFDFSAKIYQKSGTSEISCDIIESKKSLDIFGLWNVPVYVTVTRILPYHERTSERSEEEAVQMAKDTLESELLQLSQNLQLLKKEVVVTKGETGVTLECRVEAIENIAVQAEFEADEIQNLSGKEFYEP